MAEQKNTIVILIPGFAKDEQDVNCLPMQQSFMLALKNTHPDVQFRILSFEYPHHQRPYRWNGIPVTPLGGRNRGGFWRLLLRRKAMAALHDWRKKEHISGLISFWTGFTAGVCTDFGRRHNIPHLNWIMGQDARPGNRYALRKKYRADELVALSDSLQERYERSYGIRPVHIVTPGIVNMLLTPDPSARSLRIIGAGSLIPLKRFDLFIEVIAEVRKKIPLLEAAIYGDGPLRETLQQQIIRTGMQDVIRLEGEVSHDSLLHHMRQSRVLLHPSSFEGFSGVCLEARSAGIPVISYCQPMKEEMPGWYTAPDKQSMIQMLVTELLLPQEHVPFEWHTMDDTAKEIMRILFTGHNASSAPASLSTV